MSPDELITLGEIKALVHTLSIRMEKVEHSIKESHDFLAKWRFGFAILVGLGTIGAFVIGAWNGITAFLMWMNNLSHP